MEYYQTWFNKHPMTMHGGVNFGRNYWMYHYVDVMDIGFAPMHQENADGSIDVLGVKVTRLSSGISCGGSREKQQQSLAEHAEKLKAAGAVIIKQTKNRLVARHRMETGVYVVSPLTSNTFYKKEWEEIK